MNKNFIALTLLSIFLGGCSSNTTEQHQVKYAKLISVELPLKNVFYAYDLEVGDLVSPLGKGQKAHVNLLIKGEAISAEEFDEQLVLAFPNEGDGAIEVLKTDDLNEKIQQVNKLDSFHDLEFSQFSRILVNGSNKEISRSLGHGFTENLTYIFRVNSRFNNKGDVIEANYAYLITHPSYFVVNEKGREFYRSEGVVKLGYYFNPIVNDLDMSYDFVQSK